MTIKDIFGIFEVKNFKLSSESEISLQIRYLRIDSRFQTFMQKERFFFLLHKKYQLPSYFRYFLGTTLPAPPDRQLDPPQCLTPLLLHSLGIVKSSFAAAAQVCLNYNA